MTEDFLQRVQVRAYQIWEREGRPDGASESHWLQASAEILAETAETEAPVKAKSPRKARAAKEAVEAPAAKATGKTKRKAAQPKEVAVTAE